MKIVCSKSNLLNGVNTVSKAVPSKTTMSILECILIDASRGQITLTANDMELGIETVIEGEILEKGINERNVNTTRFAVLTRSITNDNSPSGKHSILMFTVRNEAGSLAKAVSIIGEYGYNMRCLRSRPMKELLWQYYFYVEIDGTVDTENGVKMIEELNKVCDQLKVAGAFAPHTEI